MKTNVIYRRTGSNWRSSHPTSRSLTYWRSQARRIFARLPQVDEVEVVRSGRKTDSIFLARGSCAPARNQYVIIASTGGKWGKSRRNYPPG